MKFFCAVVYLLPKLQRFEFIEFYDAFHLLEMRQNDFIIEKILRISIESNFVYLKTVLH